MKTETRTRLICGKCAHIITVFDSELMPRPGNRCAVRVCDGKYSFLDRADVLEDEPMGGWHFPRR